MARASGASHAAAVLVSLIAGTLLIAYLRPVFPGVIAGLEGGAHTAQSWLENSLGVRFSQNVLVPLCVAVVLAFVWGVIYHVISHGRGKNEAGGDG